jgi:hypothetical protein
MSNNKYKFDKGTRYITRGINIDMPLMIQILLWDMIDNLVGSNTNTDYLQVFRFSENDQKFIINHSQEEPEYKYQYTIKMEEEFKSLVGKTAYIIDDLDHSTLLFSEEY